MGMSIFILPLPFSLLEMDQLEAIFSSLPGS